jgi:hypothetical protein
MQGSGRSGARRRDRKRSNHRLALASMAVTWGGATGTATFTGALASDGVISGTWTDDVARGGNGVFTARPTH